MERVNCILKKSSINYLVNGLNKTSRRKGKNSIQPGVSGLRMGIGLGYPGYLESATRLIDEVRNQGLGLKLLVKKQTITFLLWRLPSKNLCYGIGPRSSMRVKRSNAIIYCCC